MAESSAGAQSKALGKLLILVGAYTKPLSTELKKAKRELEVWGREMVAVGTTLTAGLTVPLAGLGYAAFRAVGSFEKELTKSTAIMGDVSESLREELAQNARAIGRDTTFGAAKAAEAYYFLASAGLDAKQSMLALPQVARFATAGNFDLAKATDLATDAQSALGLTVKEPTANLVNLTRVTDALVAANNMANASTQQFAESLTNKAGAAARLVNKDVEETLAVLAAFADQGVKGLEAGEKFAIVLRDLQTQAIGNAEAFEKARVAVYDSSGRMRNMADIIKDLEGLLTGMSDRMKKATLAQMGFQDRSVQAIVALIGYSARIREWEERLRSAQGITQEVADKQLKNLSDQFTLLKNRLADAGVELGQGLMPLFMSLGKWLDGLVAGIGSVARVFGSLGSGARLAVGQVGLFLALLGPLTIGFGKVAAAVGRWIVAQKTLNTAFFGLAAHPIPLVIGAILALTTTIVGFSGQTDRASLTLRGFASAAEESANRIEASSERVRAATGEAAVIIADLTQKEQQLVALRKQAEGWQPKMPGELNAAAIEAERLERRIAALNVRLTELREKEIPSRQAVLARDKLTEAERVYGETLQSSYKLQQATGDVLGSVNQAIFAHETYLRALIETHGVEDSKIKDVTKSLEAYKEIRDRLVSEPEPELGLDTPSAAAPTPQYVAPSTKTADRWATYNTAVQRAGAMLTLLGNRQEYVSSLLSAQEALLEDLLTEYDANNDQVQVVAAGVAKYRAELEALDEQTRRTEKEQKHLAATIRSDFETASEVWDRFVDGLGRPLTQLTEDFTGMFRDFTRSSGQALGEALIHGKSFGEGMREVLDRMAVNAVASFATMAVEQAAYHAAGMVLKETELAAFLGLKATETTVEVATQGTMVATNSAALATIRAERAAAHAEYIAQKQGELAAGVMTAHAPLGPLGWVIGLGVAAAAVAAMVALISSFGDGGIVRGPTLALIGEKGPEAVVPLRGMGNFRPLGGGGNLNFTLEMDGRPIVRTLVPLIPGEVRRRAGV